ncbi:MAG: class I SAM-dependent rRNA methyltransferase [Anaerolineae bacterium]|nr:class I SAM-dependent rRNA methyltransferase [Chloroflexota bacterium]MBP6298468.1 class I SAM-dependent rRNA methyltransferase [Anaerolineae bacterium]
MADIIIKAGREKPIRNQHPWVFSGAIDNVRGNPEAGDTVNILASNGVFLGRGYYNPKSQIQARILTWDDEPVDTAWWHAMIQRAVAARSHRPQKGPRAVYRVINAENDFLPGLIVDRYGDWLVIQALTLGIDQRKHEIVKILAEMLEPKGIYERSDVDVRKLEGLRLESGNLWGEKPPERIEVQEMTRHWVDVRYGHKTGHYLDQAMNRNLLHGLVERIKPARMLNVFSYTGGFGVHGALAGAEVVNVDSSADVLDLARANFELNHLQAEYVEADAFTYLRESLERKDQYDVIVLDPPKFASNKQQVDKAARGYKDINLCAFRLIKSGGYLWTFSCSGAIDADLFQKIVFGALADAGRQGQILRHLGPGDDHPVALTFPEGAYLKGLLVRVY